MTTHELKAYAEKIDRLGTAEVRQLFLEKYHERIGGIALNHWNEGLFTLGLEYGILIADAICNKGLLDDLEGE